MNRNKYDFFKYATIIFFFGFIFIFPTLGIITPDKTISEIENKVLTQAPKLSLNKVTDSTFMNNFDDYVSDQFPFRTDFIKIKNYYSYLMGIREFRNTYFTKNGRLLEKFTFDNNLIDKNISQVKRVSSDLYRKYGITSKLMIIPTSIAFYEDQLPSYAITSNQSDALDYIHSRVNSYMLNNNYSSSPLEFYTPYDVLWKNKDKYIYFNTDHHWTQLGARLAYIDMYKDISNPSYKKVSDNFYGTYYSKVLLPQIKGDSIYAYEDYNNFNIKIDSFRNFDTLYNESKLSTKNKYQYFLHGDPALAVIQGNSNSKNEILIFKDSFAHNFIPFLTSNYNRIHIVDPRYYNLDINKYIQENINIKEVMFMNNIETFNSSYIYKNL